MNTKQHIVIQQLAAGLKTTRSVKIKYILNSLRIKNAAALLSTGTIAVQNEIVVHNLNVNNNASELNY